MHAMMPVGMPGTTITEGRGRKGKGRPVEPNRTRERHGAGCDGGCEVGGPACGGAACGCEVGGPACGGAACTCDLVGPTCDVKPAA